MLDITISADEQYDYEKEIFIPPVKQTLQLEHSLVSLSKWESKWCKPFFSKAGKTREETIDYIRCMTLTRNIDPEVYTHIDDSNIAQINKYIDSPMTATTIRESKGRGGRETVTSELIYYWMIALNIPFECQKWHLNRLLMLIRVCNAKSQAPTKTNKRDLMARNAQLNAARRAQYGSRG